MSDDGGDGIQIRNGDLWSGFLLLLFGLYVALEAFQLTFGTIRRPGPGFFPAVLSVLLICASGAVFLQAVRLPGSSVQTVFGRSMLPVLITVIGVAIYAATVESVGFVPCTALLTLSLLIGIGRVSWRRSLIISIGGTVVLYAAFKQIGIPLPSGIMPL